MFFFSSHPALPIFIFYSITFGFSRGAFRAILLSDVCCYPADLCRGWRMAALFSARIAPLVAFVCVWKPSSDVRKGPAQPSNPPRRSTFLSHPAVSVCIAEICHAACFEGGSKCALVCAGLQANRTHLLVVGIVAELVDATFCCPKAPFECIFCKSFFTFLFLWTLALYWRLFEYDQAVRVHSPISNLCSLTV